MIWFTFSMIFHKCKKQVAFAFVYPDFTDQSYYPFILPFSFERQSRKELSKMDQMTRDVAARNDDCHGENN